ncbi:hypothetical protein [Oryza sativa Japonica Group]|uniref:Uncharacterized protein n=1 Tax=Oryza sativa subsp. japonica TaxID=39947 RepID=Q5JKV4_ORYSJ|nr:hypothetical protein [Oryza sativa Japonica Group]
MEEGCRGGASRVAACWRLGGACGAESANELCEIPVLPFHLFDEGEVPRGTKSPDGL